MEYSHLLPLLALIGLVVTLLAFPKLGIAKPAVVAALLALAAAPTQIPEVLQKVGPSLVGVLVMMSAVQLAVSMMLHEKGGDWLGSLVVHPLHSAMMVKVPASILLPFVLLPLAMAAAAVIHNIPAVALLAPIVISICRRLRITCVPLLVGLIPASNLGGASAAWGDTPAILQRQVWGFDVSTFAVNMLPRNLMVLAMLMLTVAVWSYLANRKSNRRAMELFNRLRIRDQERARGSRRERHFDKEQVFGTMGLVGLFLAQMLQPLYALAVSMLILALLLACRANAEFVRSTFVLGDEAVLAISALFALSAVVEHSPLLQQLVAHSLKMGHGGVELLAFTVTTLISADGAASMLASSVHAHHNGSLEAAWALASGICAGSTALLTSASAGPVLVETAKRAGTTLSFRTYAMFGFPFSVAMLVGYLIFASQGVL